MDTNLRQGRSGAASQAFITGFHGDVFRRIGNMRAANPEGGAFNADKIFGAASTVHESIEETLGKTAHDVQLRADRKSYELVDDVLNAFERMKETSR